MLKPIKLTLVPDGMPALEALQHALGELTGADLYWKIVKRVGWEPGPELGHGMKGVVYGLGPGRALKITADASEIQAMTLMKDVKHPNLVRVDDVFVVCRGRSGVGVVVREYVGNVLEKIDSMDYMNSRIRNAVDDAEENFEEYVRDGGYPTAGALSMAMQDLLAYFDNVNNGNADALKIEEGIQSGITALMNEGVYGIDFDPRNIAVDDAGNAVIFDVGVVEIGKLVSVDRIGCPVGSRIISPFG